MTTRSAIQIILIMLAAGLALFAQGSQDRSREDGPVVVPDSPRSPGKAVDGKPVVVVPNTPYYKSRADAAADPLANSAPAPRARARTSPAVALPAGTEVAVRFDEEVRFGSRGTFFQAVLAEDIARNGRIVAAKGSRVRGEVFRDPSTDELSMALTDLEVDRQWEPLYTDSVEADAKKKGSFWRKFLTGAAVAGIVGGEVIRSRGRTRCGRSRSSIGERALGIGAQTGGALLLTRQLANGRGGDEFKIKKGKTYRFRLADDLMID